ncbi:MAG: ABC transporter ATP-binding protein [Magnetococcales bacterium]|nr:ABC transporter ATP-binding protein [Magnetococcales bacterium]
MISIKKLNYFYKAGKQDNRQALADLDLEIARNTLFTLTGPNGSGKSTLFRALSGLSIANQGEIKMDGLDIVQHQNKIRELMGVVFQHPALDKHLTLMENFSIHADLYGMKQSLFRQRLDEDLAWTGLKDRLGELVGTLSGGMARRVELVKALLHRPKILLMDEPTNGLDPGGRRDFLDMVDKLREEREMTILMTSHIFAEAERADRVGILHQGRLLAVGSPEELKNRLGREMVVIQTIDDKQAETLNSKLANRDGVKVWIRQRELRVEGIDSKTLDDLLANHREQFCEISIKRPTLEDLFIHITAKNGEVE